MFSFSLSLILIPYGIVVLVFAGLALFSVHNLVKYGATTHASFLATFAFLAGAVFVFFFTWLTLKDVDWGQQISVGLPTAVISTPSRL